MCVNDGRQRQLWVTYLRHLRDWLASFKYVLGVRPSKGPHPEWLCEMCRALERGCWEKKKVIIKEGCWGLMGTATSRWTGNERATQEDGVSSLVRGAVTPDTCQLRPNLLGTGVYRPLQVSNCSQHPRQESKRIQGRQEGADSRRRS